MTPPSGFVSLSPMRLNQRPPSELRPVEFKIDPSPYAEGSAMVNFGRTQVLCTVSLEENLPKWIQHSEQGWLSAEYAMLPRATHTRIKREKSLKGGRSQEISRLIGRSLRAALDLKKLKGYSLIVDCDVIQADGGTRTASITGGYVALARAIDFLIKQEKLTTNPLKAQIAAVSLGRFNGELLLDLDYEEDSACESDVNFVFNSDSKIIEVQGTAESKAFSLEELSEMAILAQSGATALFQKQLEVLK